MKILFSIFSVLISLSAVFAQTPDQYRELLKSGTDKERIEASWELFKHFRLSDRDSALVYARLNNQMAKEAGDQLALVKSYNAMGFICRANGNFGYAVESYKLGLEIAQANKFDDQQKYLLNNIALTYENNGLYEKSLEYHFKSLDHRKVLNDVVGQTVAYNNIALVYYQLDQNKEALKYLDLAIKLGKSYGADLTSKLINKGLVYLALERYDEAFISFNSAKKECLSGCTKDEQITLSGAISLGFYLIDKLDSAIFYGEKSLRLAKEESKPSRISIGYFNLARIGIKNKDYVQAFRNLTIADSIAKEIDAKKWMMDCQQLFVNLFKETGNHQKALEHYERYTAYKDSLLNKESLQKMADLRTEYEVGQKQAEVDLLTAEKENQQIIIYATTGGGLLILTLLGLVIKNNRDKNKINQQLEEQKKQLENLNKTKDKFFSIISHDLRGPVSAFAGVSRLIKGALQNNDKEELLVVADEIDHSVDHLSGLLDNLLNWAMQQQGHFPNVPEKLELTQLIKETKGVFRNMAESKSISIEVTAPESLFVWVDQNSTMTILRNLTSNALKFTPRGGTVVLNSYISDDQAVIEVADNGVGMSAHEMANLFALKGRKSAFGTAGEKGLGLGLQLVYEFVEMNNGSIEVESEEGKGTKFTVRLPLFDQVEKSKVLSYKA